MEMRVRLLIGVVGMGLGFLWSTSAGWTADRREVANEPTREQMLQMIEDTRLTDPELAAEMEQQFLLLEAETSHLTLRDGEGARASDLLSPEDLDHAERAFEDQADRSELDRDSIEDGREASQESLDTPEHKLVTLRGGVNAVRRK